MGNERFLVQMKHVRRQDDSNGDDGLYLTVNWFHLTWELYRYLIQQASAGESFQRLH